MSDSPPHDESRDEQPVPRAVRRDVAAEILAYLWSRRLFIAQVMGIAIVLFAVALLMVPKRYRATASVVIVPPRFTSEVRTEPMSVQTARRVLATDELMQEIVERLKAAKKVLDDESGRIGADKAPAMLAGMSREQFTTRLGITDSAFAQYLADLTEAEYDALAEMDADDIAEMRVSNLSEALSSEEIVEKKTAADVKVSPLIPMHADADSGPNAQLLANTWADLFQAKYNHITNDRTLRLFESIQKEQGESQAELEDIHTSIVVFRSNNNMELYKTQIEQYSTQYRQFLNQLTTKRNIFASEAGKLANYYRIVSALEANGRYVGRINVLDVELTTAAAEMPVNDFSGRTGQMPEAEGEAGEIAAPGSTSGDIMMPLSLAVADDSEFEDFASGELDQGLLAGLTRQAIEERNRLVLTISELQSFYKQFPIPLLVERRAMLQKEYTEGEGRLERGRLQLAVLEKSLAELDRQISATQQVLRVRKEVPDEAIALGAVQGRADTLRSLEGLRIESEVISPEWQRLAEARADLTRDLATVRSEVATLESDLPALEERLLSVQDRLNLGQAREQVILDALEQWRQANEELLRRYVEANSAVHESGQELLLLREEIRQLERDTSMTERRANEFQRKYDEATAVLEVLEIRKKAVERNADLLAQKLQEAQGAVRQETSDVSVAARAVTPDRHYFPRRTTTLLILSAFTFLVLTGLLARSRYMEIRGA